MEPVLSAEATVSFKREMGVSYNTTVRESPIEELLRFPVAKPQGLPPVYLVVTSQSLVFASVRAYSAGPSALKTAYSASGFVTLCKCLFTLLPEWEFFPWNIRVAFPKESQLRQRRDTHP